MALRIAAGHPAPQRERVGLLPVAFGLTGAPLAWIGLSLVNYGVASQGCTPPLENRFGAILGAAVALALVVALAALWAAYGAWRRSHAEQAGGGERTMEVGEGRTRFLALCGIVTSLGFLIGIAFALLPLVMVPSCAG